MTAAFVVSLNEPMERIIFFGPPFVLIKNMLGSKAKRELKKNQRRVLGEF